MSSERKTRQINLENGKLNLLRLNYINRSFYVSSGIEQQI